LGPTCIFKALDLGIALGSAVKIASILNVDNRIMYHVGAAAMRMNLMPEATIILGIPLSSRGKNIYFDRRWP
ncbi:MAG: ferredoxin domain-containing protein, partial [Candidatus Bathyarchaeia archaeon]